MLVAARKPQRLFRYKRVYQRYTATEPEILAGDSRDEQHRTSSHFPNPFLRSIKSSESVEFYDSHGQTFPSTLYNVRYKAETNQEQALSPLEIFLSVTSDKRNGVYAWLMTKTAT